jgi:poly(3-hydroxybutyrate) depolymerase
MSIKRLTMWVLLCLVFVVGASAQSTVTKTIQYGGATRTFYVHTPPGYNGSQALPLVVSLHGGGGNGLNSESGSGWSQKADQNNFIAVYPNGGIINAANSFLWNIYDWNGEPDDDGFLLAMINQIKVDYNVNANRIYMTGHSNGASITNTFAFAHAEVLAAIAPSQGTWMTSIPLSYLTGNPQDTCAVGTINPDNPQQIFPRPTRPVHFILFAAKPKQARRIYAFRAASPIFKGAITGLLRTRSIRRRKF